MSEKTSFNRKVNGDSLKVEPEDVSRVERVNRACTDIELTSGDRVRVKGSYEKTKKKLGLQVKPAGIENYDLNPAKDKKLKHFVS